MITHLLEFCISAGRHKGIMLIIHVSQKRFYFNLILQNPMCKFILIPQNDIFYNFYPAAFF